jgi:hypothetical protein
MFRKVGVTEKGLRVGEYHPKAKLTDHEVDLLLKLRDAGLKYSELMEKFEIPKATVKNICTGRCRCQRAVKFKLIVIG